MAKRIEEGIGKFGVRRVYDNGDVIILWYKDESERDMVYRDYLTERKTAHLFGMSYSVSKKKR